MPQQSILLSSLTPRESINFASKLRLPYDTSKEAHEANTERVLTVRQHQRKERRQKGGMREERKREREREREREKRRGKERRDKPIRNSLMSFGTSFVIFKALSLHSCANTHIGDELTGGGLSGGEKRRVKKVAHQ